jgi:hypothetical protein
VSNRVAKIQQKELIWRHCPTTQNPADIGSRGANIQQLINSTWWTGPTWLADENNWPTDITLKKTKEVSEEHRVTVQKLHTIVMKENNLTSGRFCVSLHGFSDSCLTQRSGEKRKAF